MSFDMQQTVLIYFKTFWSYYKSTACGHLAVQQLKILVAVACLCDRKKME